MESAESQGFSNKTDLMELSICNDVDLILQHLSVNDLLELSLVSDQWNKKIGLSDSFKSKVVVRIDPSLPFYSKLRSNGFNCIIKSRRKYEMLYIRDGGLQNELEFISCHKWKLVELVLMDLVNLEYMNLLRSISPTVEHLTINSVKVQGQISGISFPNLKVLIIYLTDAIDSFDQKYLVLDQLIYHSSKEDDHEKLRKILLNNPTLKKLSLTCNSLIWMEHPTEFEFSLELFQYFASPQIFDPSYSQLKNFIISQGMSLKKLELLNIYNAELIFEIWNSVMNLEDFVWTYASCGSNDRDLQVTFPKLLNGNLSINKNLKTFIMTLHGIPSFFWSFIFGACPNLTTISIDRLDEGLIKQMFKLTHLNKLLCHCSNSTKKELTEVLKEHGKNKWNLCLNEQVFKYLQQSLTLGWLENPHKKSQKMRIITSPLKTSTERQFGDQNSTQRRTLEAEPEIIPKADEIFLEKASITTFFRKDTLENILKFLSVDELLNASLVSKIWNDCIGSSMEFNNRVAVSILEHDIQDAGTKQFPSSRPRGDMNLLIKSERKYENLKVISLYPSEDPIWLKSYNWKDVNVSGLVFPNLDEYSRYLNAFGTGVEQLEIAFINVLEPHQVSLKCDKIKFPALKALRIQASTPWTIKPLITTHDKLKHFAIDINLALTFPGEHGLLTQLYADKILKFLKSNPTIESLGLHGASVEVLNKELLSKLPLKLRLLELQFEGNPSERCSNFIKQQGDSLEVLNIQSDDNSLILSVWDNLKSLRFLCLGCITFNIDCIQGYDFRKCDSLTHLCLHSDKHDIPFVVFEAIASASPNLEVVFITKLTKKIIDFAANNSSKLQTISFEKIEAGIKLKIVKKSIKNILFKRETLEQFAQNALEKLDIHCNGA